MDIFLWLLDVVGSSLLIISGVAYFGLWLISRLRKKPFKRNLMVGVIIATLIVYLVSGYLLAIFLTQSDPTEFPETVITILGFPRILISYLVGA